MTDQQKRDELNALADRCEKEWPSVDLDVAIGRAVRTGNGGMWWTRKIEDATALRPEGDDVFWRSGHDGEGPDPSLFKAEVLVVRDGHSRCSFGRARTEALARAAAALRARASILGGTP